MMMTTMMMKLIKLIKLMMWGCGDVGILIYWIIGYGYWWRLWLGYQLGAATFGPCLASVLPRSIFWGLNHLKHSSVANQLPQIKASSHLTSKWLSLGVQWYERRVFVEWFWGRSTSNYWVINVKAGYCGEICKPLLIWMQVVVQMHIVRTTLESVFLCQEFFHWFGTHAFFSGLQSSPTWWSRIASKRIQVQDVRHRFFESAGSSGPFFVCHISGWLFQIFFMFTATWGRFPFSLIFFKCIFL